MLQDLARVEQQRARLRVLRDRLVQERELQERERALLDERRGVLERGELRLQEQDEAVRERERAVREGEQALRELQREVEERGREVEQQQQALSESQRAVAQQEQAIVSGAGSPFKAARPWELEDREDVQALAWQPLNGIVSQALCGESHPLFQFAVRLFEAGGGGELFTVTGVTALQSESLGRRFQEQMKTLHERAEQGDPFSPAPNGEDAKRAVLDRLKRSFLPRSADARLANVVYVWHGGCPEAIDGISRTGVAGNLRKTDQGFFCKGMYAALEAWYACQYSTGEIFGPDAVTDPYGPWRVVLAAATLSVCYPVTRSDYPAPTGPSRYNGQDIRHGHDAHVAVVDPARNCEASWDRLQCPDHPMELVVYQEAQLIPLAVVEFERA